MATKRVFAVTRMEKLQGTHVYYCDSPDEVNAAITKAVTSEPDEYPRGLLVTIEAIDIDEVWLKSILESEDSDYDDN